MDVYIHYQSIPQNLTLPDVVEGLNEVLAEHGSVCGGQSGRLDLCLEDEKVNPKYAQMAVKAYLQQIGFARQTSVEIGGMEIGLYE